MRHMPQWEVGGADPEKQRPYRKETTAIPNKTPQALNTKRREQGPALSTRSAAGPGGGTAERNHTEPYYRNVQGV